jgi:hypothetical protein
LLGASDPKVIEVKTGRQSLTTCRNGTEHQIEKDVQLQNAGYQTEWVFLPNTNGVASPSGPLLNQLEADKIDVVIATYGQPGGGPVVVNPTGDPAYDKIEQGSGTAARGVSALDDLLMDGGG